MPLMDIKDLTFDEFKAICLNKGLPSFAASQIYSWCYQKRVEDFKAMTDIAKDVRGRLSSIFYFSSLKIAKVERSKDGSEKYLLSLSDKNAIEAVLIPDEERATLCVSSQVGCKFNCSFCLSGKAGFVRDLTAAEIVGQYLVAAREIAPAPITNIVFMGIGEPLDNFDSVVKAIRILTDPKGLGLARRRISISTCGLIPQIEALLALDLGIKLSISLHSVDDGLRTSMMPVNSKYPVAQLIKTLKAYSRNGRYPITFEYVMLPGKNMSQSDALKLSSVLKGMRSKLNLIPYNESSLDFTMPDGMQVEAFAKELKKRGVFFTLRKSKGSDIHAACGQLRAKSQELI